MEKMVNLGKIVKIKKLAKKLANLRETRKKTSKNGYF